MILSLINTLDRVLSKEKNTYRLYGKKFHYHNKSSFINTYNEIIKRGIYSFKPKGTNPIIIDCGSNMGLSLLYFCRNYPGCTVYGFEPDDSVYYTLVKNIENFNMNQVILTKKAVWVSDGNLDFYTDKGMGGRIGVEYENQVPSKVETVRLRDFISDKTIDLLKMDIEGAEFKVLQDCEPYLVNIANIFVEYHSMYNEVQKLDELLLILKRNNFRYHLSQSFSRKRPFVDKNLVCERYDMAINVFAYKEI
jgi:FkbM family methyltransferase